MARSQDYRDIVAALCTRRGVGALSAIRFILELGDVRRFPTADSIGHYLGLIPSEYTSGGTLHRGHLLKCGPGSLRAAMLQCGWASVRQGGDASLRAVYERLAPRTGTKRTIIAVTRRRVVRLRAHASWKCWRKGGPLRRRRSSTPIGAATAADLRRLRVPAQCGLVSPHRVGRRIGLQRSLSPGTRLLHEPGTITW